MGKELIRVTKCDQELAKELITLGKECENKDGIKKVIGGKTMCAHDFYEGQGRIDGAFCEFTVDEKMSFLKHCCEHGIKNIEMESLCFTGLLNHAKLKG